MGFSRPPSQGPGEIYKRQDLLFLLALPMIAARGIGPQAEMNGRADVY